MPVLQTGCSSTPRLHEAKIERAAASLLASASNPARRHVPRRRGEGQGVLDQVDFWVEFPEGYRTHQIRLEGGDCSTDSFCYPSV